jgi:hypothetical protein
MPHDDKDLLVGSIRDAIEDAFNSRFDRFRADDPDYEERIAWVRSQIQKEKDMHRMRMKVIESSIGWALPLFIAFVAVAVWHEITAAVVGGQ